jgi:cytochrome c-type biogenesis protein CcmH
MRRVSLLAALALALLPTVAVAAAQTTLTDLEDEVMCPICGTLLELSEAPQAHRERVYIAQLIAAGETKEQVKDALLAEYGPKVLALPEGKGFNLSAYVFPAVAFAIAALALAIALARWRKASTRARSGSPPSASAPEAEDAERLEADLARYDL